MFISCNQGTWFAKTPNKIKFRYFLKCVNDLVKDYEKPDCAACSSSSELEHFTDETDNVESSNTLEDNNRPNTAEKSTNTVIIWNRSRKTQTEKTETRTFPTQTHLQVNTNCSPFEKSASLKYDKEVQTEGEVVSFQAQIDDEQTTAMPMPTEIPPPDDDIPGSQSEMNDCITTSDTILDEFVKNSSDEDFTSLTESSDSEGEANSESEYDLEQENILNYRLSKDKPASEQIKIVIFEEAIVNAFRNCLKCGEPCTVSLERQIGSTCNIHVSCSNTTSHDFTWSTGPMINRLPAFHLLFAAGILSTGLGSAKVIRMFDALKIININKRGLSNILKSYVIPAVFHVWDRDQKSNLANIKDDGKKVSIASDMRVDSPGHCGLLGSGSTLDLERKIVLDTQVIKVSFDHN